MTWDVSGDFAVIDSLETLTLFRRTSTSAFDSGTAVPLCLREPLEREEIGGQVLLKKGGLRFQMWAANVTGAAPKVADVVQDFAGIRYTVLKVGTQTVGTRYDLTCIKEV